MKTFCRKLTHMLELSYIQVEISKVDLCQWIPLDLQVVQASKNNLGDLELDLVGHYEGRFDCSGLE